ncbi:alpha/beta hydrolase [Flavobacteriaceae bacterium]|jgi:pimeloyl-ACP methyl ester carboxylesterase|nr:alpha/beta hydrolase [Flavobacteriaceae bacterium]MDB2630511.1 alpha/beta hydrolase [Ulvibacter sp.]MDB4114823.1 alpha/beta hydrolase [Flavobacteriaceae bacterium]MDB9858052.1 alpha/beta hydrolase [Flavobacteriaceae bacterium]MDB9858707.1 alpha/beta hydrolase [Flavobacteriaceae bacterium]
MAHQLKEEGKFKYLEIGEGTPMIILHGLMGGLSNFNNVAQFFPEKGYKVIIPELPLFELPLLTTNVNSFAKYLKEFISHKKLDKVILLGNSLGGHIGLLYTKQYPQNVKALVITGSSGLYESAMGESYPKRGDRNYIKTKTENVFYDPAIATPELVDEVFETVNDRVKLIRTLAIAKSAIRHNMGKDLPKMNTPTCIIWGENDSVTPPEVGTEFHEKLPDSDLFWIKKCGHAAMMEHPDTFNEILIAWLEKRSL